MTCLASQWASMATSVGSLWVVICCRGPVDTPEHHTKRGRRRASTKSTKSAYCLSEAEQGAQGPRNPNWRRRISQRISQSSQQRCQLTTVTPCTFTNHIVKPPKRSIDISSSHQLPGLPHSANLQ
ncbi:hypothetical protein P152DRAFT_33475 [Eremomyces bilateralis CBS 781.70]|uniref:Secreted protein n=1 Tax=Eremomyces bilateralis CBS 781.70 TaxID=1392243 RepID=A0A6G1G2L6_9PEZI|nr:uncharacterized protein P152DRAFT_33475 [Eremomyces bilateralis CBS 781.70]KAF1812357.1 hypothetical protein P152DRAFT_33475 [Eremomyces bilateralis CBS 781.70]